MYDYMILTGMQHKFIIYYAIMTQFFTMSHWAWTLHKFKIQNTYDSYGRWIKCSLYSLNVYLYIFLNSKHLKIQSAKSFTIVISAHAINQISFSDSLSKLKFGTLSIMDFKKICLSKSYAEQLHKKCTSSSNLLCLQNLHILSEMGCL